MKVIPLELPPFDGTEAIEVLRVWVDRDPVCQTQTQKFVIRPEPCEDPGEWGVLLVDIARQVAHAYAAAAEQQKEEVYSAVLETIKALFDAEWNNPTE